MTRQVKKGSQVLTRQRSKLHEPGMWKVLLHNDDYTTQEFVVFLLKTVFRKAEPEATAIMLAVHRAGVWSVMSAYNSVNGEWCGQNFSLELILAHVRQSRLHWQNNNHNFNSNLK